MIRPRYPYICFDADNTLFDFNAAERYAIEATFRDFSIPYTPDILKIYEPYNQSLWLSYEEGHLDKTYLLHHRFTWLGEQIGHPIDGVAFHKRYNDHLMETYHLIDGSVEVCKALAPYCTLALTTNGNTDMQRSRFERSELKPYFSYLFISDELGCAKPSEAYFSKVFSQMEIHDKTQVLMVGDSIAADMIGANRFGFDCCWFNPSGQTQTKARLTYEIHDLTELIPIVLSEDDSK